MFVDNGKISKRQCLILLLFALFGTTLLFLPTELVRVGGKNGWIAIVFYGILCLLVVALLCVLCQKGRGKTLVMWYRYVFGHILGTVIAIGLLVHVLFVGAMEVRVFGEVIAGTMLSKTPVWLLMAVFLVAIVPVAMGGVEVIGRMAEVLFFFVAIPLVVVLVALMLSVDFGRLLPVKMLEIEVLLDSSMYFAPVAQGLILLPFFFLHTKWKKGSRVKPILVVVTISMCLVLCMTILAIGVYGESALSGKLLPTMQMMERMGIANVFLNRSDLLFLWFWMVSTYLFLSMILLFATKVWHQILGISQTKISGKWCWFWCILLWAVSNIPGDLWEAYAMRLTYLSYGNMIFLVVIPVGLLVIDCIKRRKENA